MKERGYLPIRPRPKSTESGLGYVLRLMQANGYPLSTVIRDLLKSAGRQTQWGLAFPVTDLSRLILGYRDELERISYLGTPGKRSKRSRTRASRAFKILGHPLGGNCGDVHRADAPVVCPECVREAGYVDAFFDLRAAVACPEHRKFVVRKCPGCKAPLNWTRSGLLKCRCGTEFAGAERVSTPESLVRLLAVLKAKLHGEPLEGVAPDAGFPVDFLDRMLLINLLRLLPRLGVMRLELLGERNSTEDSIYESAAAVLRDWPRNFHEMLRQYGEREVARGNGSYGIFKRFYGFLGPVLRLLRGDPARDWLRVEFAKFARENWGVLHRKGASKGVQNRFVSLSAYARNNGLTVASVKRLIQEDILGSVEKRVGYAAT